MGGWPFAAVSTSNLNCSVVSPRRTRSEKPGTSTWSRSEEHTSELQSPCNLVCRLLLEKKKKHGADCRAQARVPERMHSGHHSARTPVPPTSRPHAPLQYPVLVHRAPASHGDAVQANGR